MTEVAVERDRMSDCFGSSRCPTDRRGGRAFGVIRREMPQGEDEREYLIVPHEVATGADCDGCLIVEEHGDMVEIKCNSCGGVVDTVPIRRAGTRLMELASANCAAPAVRIAEQPKCFAASPSSKRSPAGNAARALMS